MIFDIYKPGQGKNTRLFSALGLAVIVGLGCWKLYQELNARSINPWIETIIPFGLCIGLFFLIFLLTNKHKAADFMIAAEGEVKKVSWSSRQEIIASTIIVIIVVVFMALLLGLTDLCFQLFFGWLFKTN
jgi:preprotein translocase subunit SecE